MMVEVEAECNINGSNNKSYWIFVSTVGVPTPPLPRGVTCWQLG